MASSRLSEAAVSLSGDSVRRLRRALLGDAVLLAMSVSSEPLSMSTSLLKTSSVALASLLADVDEPAIKRSFPLRSLRNLVGVGPSSSVAMSASSSPCALRSRSSSDGTSSEALRLRG